MKIIYAEKGLELSDSTLQTLVNSYDLNSDRQVTEDGMLIFLFL